ncbi:MAG: alpha/beta hydrolase [Bacteroidota bacterium]
MKAADPAISWVIYLQGAEHLVEIQLSLDVAQAWIQKSKMRSKKESEWNPQYYPKEYILGHLAWIELQYHLLTGNKDESKELLQTVFASPYYKKRKDRIDAFLLEYNELEDSILQSPSLKDTFVSMGHHEIYFKYIEGKGNPILFESGAGNDGSVWLPIVKEIHFKTGAPIIMYDRAGFGKSTIDSSNLNIDQHGIEANLKDLEMGLDALGYNDEIHLVAHSYGSYLSYLFSNKYPSLVKSLVAIDVVHRFHSEGWAEKINKEMENEIEEWKSNEPGMYFLMKSLPNAASLIEGISIPDHILVVNIRPKVDEQSLDEGGIRWQEIHKRF